MPEINEPFDRGTKTWFRGILVHQE
jgi:hypothetical protein